MKIKFIAAPLVAGALMVPATLSTPRLRLPFRLFPPCQVTLQTHTSCSRVSTVVSRRSTTI